MCGIIGCYLESPSPGQINSVKRLFVESKVRGMHATGFSILEGGQVKTIAEPLPADKFVEEHFDPVKAGDYTLSLIGHTRYSTSDLRFNQPIQVFGDHAIAHNGVIDQRPISFWGEYGYDLTTANDSELVYHSSHSGGEPLMEFPNASMAVCELNANKGIRFYRNGKRPGWMVNVDNGFFVCSTKDIAIRSGFENPVRMEPGVIYTPHKQTKIANIEEIIP